MSENQPEAGKPEPVPPAPTPTEEGGPITIDRVMNALQPVQDPEIALSIVDLGLIYGVDITEEGKKVEVSMTLTSPMCPFGPQLVGAAQTAVQRLPGVKEAKITLVWVPRWDPREHATEEAKAYLGLW
jgi:metal-sulfur cluster biosynthetic enzyme